ncbi:hypothetical protein BS47DRAFT_1353479 [Hydnum rufescens UP504]|uniref:Uncharacterized protein n=1 Tax=Hydnum rufescens UP504 TaxID=1448309 RepID=A0A9P6DP47_9AGAM|nr:hypothetical protein BS47DRAFT_1353479 [Hydnum rufescens UP504]
MRFYQLGGFNSHLRDWRDVPQGHNLVRKTGAIEMVLGIRHSGAWYILIPEDELPRSVRCDRPHISRRTLRQDSRKNKKNRIHDQSKRDTSEANNHYSLGPVVLGALRKTLRVSKFIIGDSLWNGLVNRFIIFASTPSSPAASRVRRAPLDTAWTEVSFSETGAELFGQKNHFFTPDAALYLPSEYKEADPHSHSTDFGGESIRTFFNETIRPHDKMREGTAPAIILVYDAVFAFMTPPNWELGATSLLVQTSALPIPRNAHHQDSLVAGSRRPADSRSRSRSPPMNREHDGNSSSSSRRPASPPRRTSLAPVYVIDIQSLWLAMPGMSRPAPSLLDMAHRLNLEGTAGSSFPAGNDLDLMYKVWTSLVGAAPIDDQVKVILPGLSPSLGSTANSAASDPVKKTQENSEDEDDATSPGKVARTETQPTVDDDPYSAFDKWASEDEDLDYC